MPRHENLQSWLYRIQPSITHEPFSKVDNGNPIDCRGSDLRELRVLYLSASKYIRQPA